MRLETDRDIILIGESSPLSFNKYSFSISAGFDSIFVLDKVTSSTGKRITILCMMIILEGIFCNYAAAGFQ